MMQRILVIGGTGTVGREVVSQLGASGTAVRVLTRQPGAASLTEGVEVRAGDLTVPESLDGALDGIDGVLLIWTAPAGSVTAALERITRQVGRVVLLTSPHTVKHPFFNQPNPVQKLHALLEQTLRESGVQWTILRPGMFAANAIGWWGRQMRAGGPIRWPYLDAPTAPIDPRDIAAVGTRALCHDGHAGAEYVLTGPESLTQRQQIEIIGRAAGRPAEVEELTPEEAARELGFPPPVIRMLMDAWAAALGQPAVVTSTVAEVTGRPARTFAEWAADHAAAFRP
jgi:uncharacterized protein YbjT (DUF2867 family)